ncbi:Ff.00g065680.m01.CDS01 [Fusarium sp. VM40]|nr:Ff.00g065680.m01.CDS01 [Fusarium sp. VM40]
MPDKPKKGNIDYIRRGREFGRYMKAHVSQDNTRGFTKSDVKWIRKYYPETGTEEGEEDYPSKWIDNSRSLTSMRSAWRKAMESLAEPGTMIDEQMATHSLEEDALREAAGCINNPHDSEDFRQTPIPAQPPQTFNSRREHGLPPESTGTTEIPHPQTSSSLAAAYNKVPGVLSAVWTVQRPHETPKSFPEVHVMAPKPLRTEIWIRSMVSQGTIENGGGVVQDDQYGFGNGPGRLETTLLDYQRSSEICVPPHINVDPIPPRHQPLTLSQTQHDTSGFESDDERISRNIHHNRETHYLLNQHQDIHHSQQPASSNRAQRPYDGANAIIDEYESSPAYKHDASLYHATDLAEGSSQRQMGNKPGYSMQQLDPPKTSNQHLFTRPPRTKATLDTIPIHVKAPRRDEPASAIKSGRFNAPTLQPTSPLQPLQCPQARHQESEITALSMNQNLNEERTSEEAVPSSLCTPSLPTDLPLVQWYVEHRRAKHHITFPSTATQELVDVTLSLRPQFVRMGTSTTPKRQDKDECAKKEVSGPDFSDGTDNNSQQRQSKSTSLQRRKSQGREICRPRYEPSSESSSSSDEAPRKSHHRHADGRKPTKNNNHDDDYDEHEKKEKRRGRHSRRSKHYQDEETELEELEKEFTRPKSSRHERHRGRKRGQEDKGKGVAYDKQKHSSQTKN